MEILQKYFWSLVTGFLCCMLISVVSVHANVLLVDDFDDAKFVNKLGGVIGSWKNDPFDKTSGCTATFASEEKGHSLKLDYDIDSAKTYYFVPDTYILDYSAYSIVGLAPEVPHTAFSGCYFILGGIDLSNYKFLIFYACGDENKGYTRRFQVELKTKNQSSKFIVDGVTGKWKKFVIPLSIFEKIENWKEITEFVIVFNENIMEKTGAIYFDNICFSTDATEEVGTVSDRAITRYDECIVSPEEAEAKSELFLSGNLGVNYRWTPERKNEIFNSAGATMEGKTGKLSGRVEAVVESQEFGQSVYQKFTDVAPYREFYESSPTISIPTIQLNVNELNPLFNRLTFGNIWLGYSPYIISPFWGWKGISVSGRKGNFEQSTFLIKSYYNSFSVGSRCMFYMDGQSNHRLQLIGLHDSETAKLDGSSITDGKANESGDWAIKPVSYENSYLINSLSRFFHYGMNLELTYGFYRNKELAKADYSDPTNPVYSHSISSAAISSELYEYKLFFDGLPFFGTKLIWSYRDIGTNFRPKYRQQPIVFEDVIADQKGHKIQVEQWYKGFNVNALIDNIVRKSDEKYYRKTTNYGVGFFGPKGMELKLNREIRTEEYKNSEIEPEIDRNEEVDSMKVSCQYNFIYPDTPGLRLPLASKLTFSEDNIFHPDTNEKYITHTLQIDIDYKLMTNFGFWISYKATRFGDPSWEPKKAPYSDNYFSVLVNLNF
ncbi:MAG: hypothetical protein V1833_06580 [Elusimicrobiota bacterium]